jgi:hypothetical protein
MTAMHAEEMGVGLTGVCHEKERGNVTDTRVGRVLSVAHVFPSKTFNETFNDFFNNRVGRV